MVDLNTGGGQWYTSPVFQEVRAAKAWAISWDDWQQLSDESKAVMLEYYREEQQMETWEIKERDRKAKLK